MTPMTFYAESLFDLLNQRDEKIVFAESCTAGKVSSMFAEIPGASNYLCGSFVTYRASQKMAILGVPQEVIDEHTTESVETAIAMAENALRLSPEADWAASIVGHLGPNAPPEKDGKIYMHVIGKNNSLGKIPRFTFTETLGNSSRCDRIRDAANWLLRSSGEMIGSSA